MGVLSPHLMRREMDFKEAPHELAMCLWRQNRCAIKMTLLINITLVSSGLLILKLCKMIPNIYQVLVLCIYFPILQMKKLEGKLGSQPKITQSTGNEWKLNPNAQFQKLLMHLNIATHQHSPVKNISLSPQWVFLNFKSQAQWSPPPGSLPQSLLLLLSPSTSFCVPTALSSSLHVIRLQTDDG